jgi:hypothetical protein
MAENHETTFAMLGVREILDDAGSHIAHQVDALEKAVASDIGLTFDFSRSLLESTCKTILNARLIGYDEGWELPRLFSETLKNLRLVPVGFSDETIISDSLKKIPNGFKTMLQGIGEIRNKYGVASHGRDDSFQQLDSMQALLVARTTDAIVSFLFMAHRAYSANPAVPRIDYVDHSDFNDFVNENHEAVKIFDEEFEPSRILFDLAPEPYRVYLTEFQTDQSAESETRNDEPSEPNP